MPLRLRRGSDVERQNFTPAEAELIFVTDTNELWVGDGSTQGGLKVTGTIPTVLNDFLDVDLSVAPQLNQILKWNGTAFVPSNDSGASLSNASIGELNDVDLSIPPSSGQILQWDGANFAPTTLSVATDGSGVIEGSNYRINIAGDDSTLIVDSTTNTVTGNFIGSVFSDESTLIVDSTTNTVTGNFIGDITGSVFSDDSTLIVDSITNTVTGSFIGDITGSVLSEDSTILVDAANRSFQTSSMEFNQSTITDLSTAGLDIVSQEIRNWTSIDIGVGSWPRLTFQGYRNFEEDPEPVEIGDVIGNIASQGFTGGGYATGSAVAIIVTDNNITNGSTNIDCDVLIGNSNNMLISNNKYLTIDQNGVTSAPVFKTGTYSNETERDFEILNPEPGMIILLSGRDDSSGFPVFQGYDGTDWRDLT